MLFGLHLGRRPAVTVMGRRCESWPPPARLAPDIARPPRVAQLQIPAAQLAEGQVIEGWFKLTDEEGSNTMKDKNKQDSMISVVIQYQNVLQVPDLPSVPAPSPGHALDPDSTLNLTLTRALTITRSSTLYDNPDQNPDPDSASNTYTSAWD